MRKLRILNAILCTMLLIEDLFAQLPCATDGVYNRLLETSTAFRRAVERQDLSWAYHQANNQGRLLTEDTLAEIPVVIHVIHSGQAVGTTYNPSDSALQAVITNLNDIFAASFQATFLNILPDNSYFFTYVNTDESAEIPIRFRLAKRTPDCQPTNGIVRVNGGSLPGYSQFGMAYLPGSPGASEASIKSLSAWPNSLYLNIWIVTDLGGPGGFAYLPTGPASLDGVTVDADFIDNNVLLAHEVGHYLGLYHTFQDGCANSNCTTQGDRVCDTDPTTGVGCLTGANPCTNQPWGLLGRNFMNYLNEFCLGVFTPGQSERMLFMLENFRSSLLTSLGALPPGTEPPPVPAPVTACVPSGNTNSSSTNIGPTTVQLADLQVVNGGYLSDNSQFYINHTVTGAPGCSSQAQPIAHLTTGETYTITVITADLNEQNVRGWIDFNNNGSFQSSELVISSNGTTGFQTHTASFTVPPTGTVTCTPLRMRISADFASSPPPQACVNLSYGQVEDFTIIVQAPATSVPSLDIAAMPSDTICAGTNVTFTATPVGAGANPAYQWKINGINAGANASTFSSNALTNNDIVSCVMTTSLSCPAYPAFISNIIQMNVTAAPSITISASPASTVCEGTSAVFTAATTGGGGHPGYQWKINGINTGTNNNTFNSNSLSSGNVITCDMTTAAACPASQTVGSNSIVMTINNPPAGSPVIPSPVAACIPPGIVLPFSNFNAGPTSVTLADLHVTSDPYNAGYPNPQYYADHTAASMPGCIQNQPVAHLTLGQSYTISVQTVLNTQIVRGWIDFNNDGDFQASERIINSYGQIQGDELHSSSFTLPAGATITCMPLRMRISADYIQHTSLGPCSYLVEGQAEDFIVVIKDPSLPPPSVNISQMPAGAVCAGANVTFTAAVVSGGSNPSYQWKLNGNNVGTNSSTYSASTLSNADVVSCVVTSSDLCANSSPVTSNPITMIINPTVTPSVNISSNVTGAFCAGTPVTFTATPSNGGSAPVYQWKINGNNVGAGSSSYTSNTLNNGDIVNCVMSSSLPCASSPAVTSNSISLVVNPVVSPAVSITFDASGSICAGTNVTFTASATNGGSSPVYQWKKNNNIVGSNSVTYSDAGLANGDLITCTLTSSNACANPATVMSSAITMVVNPVPSTPTVTVGGPTTFCDGGSVLLTSSAASGNQWTRDGTDIAGATAATHTAGTGGSYTVRVTNASNCSASSAATVVTVNAIPAKPTITQTGNQLSSSAAGGNQWFKDGVAIPSATGQTFIPTESGNYSVQVTLNGCKSPMSDGVNITITAINDPALQGAVLIFPNPFDDLLYIKCGAANRVTVRLCDLGGKVLLIKTGINGTESLSVSHLAAGPYIIHVTDETTNRTFAKLLFRN